MSIDVIGQKDGFVIRLAKADDAVDYYEQNYCPLDKEVARLTGCKEEFWTVPRITDNRKKRPPVVE